MRGRGRYVPMWDELAGTIKVFLFFWFAFFIVFMLILGLSYWALWGALGFGFILALIFTLIFSLFTGVKNVDLPKFKLPKLRK